MISIIICTYNREKYLELCLNALGKQNITSNLYEVLIIDNNSSDNTKLIGKTFSSSKHNFFYFLEHHQGLSFARNRGIKEAKGNTLIFLDDDVIAPHNYLNNILLFQKENPQIKVFGGKTTPFFEEEQPKWLSTYLMPLYAQINLGEGVKKMKNHQFPVGANMIFRRSVFNENVFFNINLGRKGDSLEAGEEKQLFNELRQRKIYPYYSSQCEVKHLIPATRLNLQYVKKQALGIGKSERIRSRACKEYSKSVFLELLKWIATAFLSFLFIVKLQPSKGITLIKFRVWVSTTLLFKTKNNNTLF